MKELIAVVAIIVLGVAIGGFIIGFSDGAEIVRDVTVDDITTIIE